MTRRVEWDKKLSSQKLRRVYSSGISTHSLKAFKIAKVSETKPGGAKRAFAAFASRCSRV